MSATPQNTRTLVLVLGDQLSHASPALAGIDAERDAVLMIEAPGEATHVWSHKARIALFLSAMRHFRDELRERGFTVHYVALGDSPCTDLPGRLREQLQRLRPETLRLLEAGEWRLQQDIASVASAASVALRVLDDTHFMCSRDDFKRWSAKYGRQLRMEFFYREMRREHRVLLDAQGQPEGGQWNFDADNRKAYPKAGPGLIPPAEAFEPDALTRQVFKEVQASFPDHPGSLQSFMWPVTRVQALRALQTFIDARLANFGEQIGRAHV